MHGVRMISVLQMKYDATEVKHGAHDARLAARKMRNVLAAQTA